MRRFIISAPLIALMMMGGNVLRGADWPQWRGPARDGRSTETGLLQEWPQAGPPLVWRTDGIGSGFSSVSISDGRIYTLGDRDDGQYALALTEEDGKLLWSTRVGRKWQDRYLGPRSTPTVDGSHIYITNTAGDVICLESATGKEAWRRSLPQDFGSHLMQAMGTTDWKYSESPLVDGDRVIVTPGVAGAALVALDKLSGNEIWRTAAADLGPYGRDGAGYSSIVESRGAGIKQYVQLIGRGLIGVEAETGVLLWTYGKIANDVANIATPLIDGDYVFASTGYGTGATLLQLVKGENGGVQAIEKYFLGADTFQNRHGGMILDRGTVYTGTGHNKGFPIAVRLEDGSVAWGPERNDGDRSAAVAYADGRIYLRYENGRMILVEATPESYRERGSFDIPDVRHPSWSHPVIANGRLYLREQDSLYSYDVSAAD